MTDIDALIRLTVALLLGSVIGIERYIEGKDAGMRTLGLVALGSALFTMVGTVFASGTSDPSRVASQIVVGIGFLGAGIVLQTKQGPRNLTTATTVWVVAAIGMAAGVGWWVTAVGSTVLMLIALRLLEPLEKRFLPRKTDPEPDAEEGSNDLNNHPERRGGRQPIPSRTLDDEQ